MTVTKEVADAFGRGTIARLPQAHTLHDRGGHQAGVADGGESHREDVVEVTG